jgi:hypothetical protein
MPESQLFVFEGTNRDSWELCYCTMVFCVRCIDSMCREFGDQNFSADGQHSSLKHLNIGFILDAITNDGGNMITISVSSALNSLSNQPNGLNIVAASHCVAIRPALTLVAAFSLCNIKRATRSVSASLHCFVAPFLALPSVFQVILPLPQLVLDAFPKLCSDWVDVEIVRRFPVGGSG